MPKFVFFILKLFNLTVEKAANEVAKLTAAGLLDLFKLLS